MYWSPLGPPVIVHASRGTMYFRGSVSTMKIFSRLSGMFLSVFLISLALSTSANAQVNSAISGTVEDATKALIPGVSITATNTQTGVESRTITNESGAYNFAALNPGTYRVKAELTGFNTKTDSGIELGAGVPIRQNFVLEVGAAGTSVNVEIATESLLAATSASIGEVLTADRAANLPL